MGDEPYDADRSTDAAPAITIKVQTDKQISGKKWNAHHVDTPCVAPGLFAQGKEEREPLIGEVERRGTLAMGLALNRRPPLAAADKLNAPVCDFGLADGFGGGVRRKHGTKHSEEDWGPASRFTPIFSLLCRAPI